jgi:hypothetical protein
MHIKQILKIRIFSIMIKDHSYVELMVKLFNVFILKLNSSLIKLPYH